MPGYKGGLIELSRGHRHKFCASHLDFPTLGVDISYLDMLISTYYPKHVLFMSQSNNPRNRNEMLIKFVAPDKLKRGLQELAAERNITLSAMLRLISSEYVKRTQEK